jgi:hypothetical protein
MALTWATINLMITIHNHLKNIRKIEKLIQLMCEAHACSYERLIKISLQQKDGNYNKLIQERDDFLHECRIRIEDMKWN